MEIILANQLSLEQSKNNGSSFGLWWRRDNMSGLSFAV